MGSTSNGLLEDLLSYNHLIHAVAGATGSVVGMSTFYPLDIVRTRFQGILSLILCCLLVRIPKLSLPRADFQPKLLSSLEYC